MKTRNPYPEIAELAAARIERDWTFDELAEQMRTAGFYLKGRTLYYLIRELPKDATPNDRTLYKIRKYLEIYRRRDRHRQREAKRRAAAASSAVA